MVFHFKKLIVQVVSLFILSTFLFACTNKINPENQLSEENKFKTFLDSLRLINASQHEKATAIRKYLAQRIDMGDTRDSLTYNYHLIPWNDFSGYNCLQLYEENKVTGVCGLTSYVLAKLYQTAGIKSYVYDCGYYIGLSHEFNLVDLEGKLILQDAYYNITIVDSNETPKDFLEVLSEIRSGNFENIRLLKTETINEYWLTKPHFDSLSKIDNAHWKTYKNSIVSIDSIDNRVRIKVKRQYELATQIPLEALKPKFKEDSLPENYLSIYLLPRHVKDGNTGLPSDSLMNKILAVVKEK